MKFRSDILPTSDAQGRHFDALVRAPLDAPLAAMGVCLSPQGDAIREVVYLAQIPLRYADMGAQYAISKTAERAAHDVARALVEPDFVSDFPRLSQGTPFQNKVWQVISGLQAGQVLTYQQLAQMIACGAPRAVGGACGANPYPLLVPCHRIIAKNGIGGFARNDSGFYVGVKQWLLAREGIAFATE